MRPLRVNPRLWLGFWLALASTCISCSGKDDAAQGNSPGSQHAEDAASTTSGAVDDDRPAVDSNDLNALVDLVVADAADIPRVEFQPSVLAQSLGKDPAVHVEWVRNHTWWVPYRGLLRGSQGVLLDRVGSNLDRSVLLADLLRNAGHSVRLAHAQLPEAQARELLESTKQLPEQRLTPPKRKPRSIEREKASAAILPDLDVLVDRQAAAATRLSKEARELVGSQTSLLATAITKPAAVGGEAERTAVAAMRDYWWVEHEKDGNWIALDVHRPDGAQAAGLVPASETFAWKGDQSSPSLPDSNWHTVQVRVIVERSEAGTTSEFVVLETKLRPAEVLGRPTSLMHMPSPWPERTGRADPGALKNAALWVSEWVPFLQIGDDFVVQSGFTERGELKRNPIAPLGELGGGGLLGGMDQALGGAEDVESTATAEWIEYEIQVPNEPTRKIRRSVFDLRGPARRAAGGDSVEPLTDARKLERFEALASRIDILLQPCSFTPEFAAHLASAGIVANQAAIKELAKETDRVRASARAVEILQQVNAWDPLTQFVLARADISGQPGDWYVAQPNVLNYRLTFPLATAGSETTREMIDIVTNPVAVRNSAKPDHFSVRLQQGVADTVAEMLAIGSALRTAENTTTVFTQQPAGSGNTLVINALDGAATRALAWSPDATSRLLADVEAGHIAVVPRKAVLLDGRERTGWWRVDPQSGETIGVMDSGFNTATTDQANLRATHSRLLDFKLNNFRDASTLRRMNPQHMTRGQLDDLAFYNRLDETIDALTQFFL